MNLFLSTIAQQTLDGDSLVYVLMRPAGWCINGQSLCRSRHLILHIFTVSWNPPYGPSNLFGGTPLTIDAQTGWLHGNA
jgi:hypothetical protein